MSPLSPAVTQQCNSKKFVTDTVNPSEKYEDLHQWKLYMEVTHI
jgi:hypothetical protein